MILTPEQTKKVLADAAKIVAEMLWREIEKDIEEYKCMSITRAAATLDLSTDQTRRLLKEVVDFGERNTRVTAAQLRKLIKDRTVKAS